MKALKLMKITETSIDALRRRLVKLWNGNVDTVTAIQYGPFGSDSNPPAGSIAIYGRTEMDGKEVCIGVMSKEFLAAPGEHRIFSTDNNSAFKFNIWLRADGIAFIGDSNDPSDYTNFAVKHNELKQDLDALKATVNANAAIFNSHTHLYAPGPGVPVPTAPTTTQSQSNSTDFSNIKNSKIKTN